jgi:hypothetical protein
MRHNFRLNRVCCGIPGQLRQRVWTLPEQPSSRAPVAIYCASVSPNVRCVSAIVRRTPLPSQPMCAETGALLCVCHISIARRYN